MSSYGEQALCPGGQYGACRATGRGDGDYVTGQTWAIDGGLSVQRGGA